MNLNNPGSVTVATVAQLLASKDDSQHRQLRVMINGDVILSDDVGNRNLAGVRFRFETWNIGNGYVGPKAANDPKWVQRVHDDLQRHWHDGSTGYIDL